MKNKNNKTHDGKHHALDKLVFYGTVTITGAAVMMVELLGTRIIGPFYGVSLVVWSSLLSVSLLALSIGYSIGGRCADKGVWLRLPHAVFASAVLVAIIPLISEPVQLMFNGWGLRAGALASAFVLFTPPLIFLGMAGPFVIRMATERLESVGSTAGNVYAISTVGSVVGTLLLGFFLLPIFGTYAILLSVAVVLLCLSLALAFYEKNRLDVPVRLVPWLGAASCLCIALLWQFNADSRTTEGYNVVFEQETHYGWVRVVDHQEKKTRWLMSDASTIGAEHLPSGKGLLGYQSVVRMLPWFKPGSQNALLIGLGAGHLVADLGKYGIKTDAIEIDPAVAYAAEAYFNLKPTGKVIVGDARYQVQQLNDTYDLIIHDCFTGGSEPFHLLSQEMMRELKTKLKPGGVLAINFVGFTDKDQLKPVQTIAATLDSVFTHRKSYLVSPHAEFSDYVFMVSDTELDPTRLPNAEATVGWLAELETNISSAGARPITDDYNPLEFLQIAKAEYYRNMLIDRVGAAILFR
ncbi:fused MFS/spermidine synthase [Teredinibacter franksiae]|uniref:fused MFS/spermidine synthase n=1 Tax=Teredinibacter franksiae TaxID=2761453 RepID=UPI00162AF6A7|nr:fused MFS/spermidine synthase [Teredinibacter franksiae]